MGEVYLGLQEGAGGFERFVVVKRIYPQFVGDEHFTGMLLQEARLAASIRHPNVVQILDIGHSVDGYFVVMEYLSGETAFFITRTLHARGETMPPSIACRIIADVAAGLHCAHTATDPGGHPQPIVHRDVTPSNLIACFNGVVKIVDFGVAKAAAQHEGQTRGGLKGKMSYLAPEQLYDQPIDGRADVFQLGICLHEFLTGKRLFKADSDPQRVMAVLQQRIPAPSELVPTLPKQLDEVVLWALERDPDQRPATADDFRRELEIAAGEVGVVSGHDLGGWMRTAFADRLRERNRFERHCAFEMREGRSLSGEMPAATVRAASRSDVDASIGDRSGSGRPGLGVSVGGVMLPESGSFPRTPSGDLIGLSPPPPGETESHGRYSQSQHRGSPEAAGWMRRVGGLRGKWTFLGLSALMVLVALGVALVIDAGRKSKEKRAAQGEGAVVESAARPVPQAAAGSAAATAPATASAAPAPEAPRAQPLTFEVAVSVVPAQATIEVDGVEVGRGSYRATLPVDGTRHVMRVRATGYGAVELEFTDQPPPSRLRLDPLRAAAVEHDSAPAAKPVRRASTPEPARRRPTRPRGRADEGSGDESRDDGTMSDNPDPWAEEPDDRAGDRHPEGAE
jgi:eukaryotic-like serine/threonine-protein kinase